MLEDRSSAGEAQCCFGFQVRSSHPFRFLRNGGGDSVLEVIQTREHIAAEAATLLYEWTLPDRDGAVNARLYRADGRFHFWTSDAGWFRIDPAARRIEMGEHDDEIRREQRLWGIPTVLCAKDRGDFALHAAAVEVDGAAVMLAAPGRFGKTTLALAFHRRGYRLLTEDTACCRLTTEPLLFPGPACIRLRPDIFTGRAPAGTSVTAVRTDRIHLTIDADRKGDGRPVPIKALVFLREAADRVHLEPVKKSEALPDLWTLTFRIQTDAERRRAFQDLAELATVVPAWNLYRPLQLESLDEVVTHLVETCTR
jgi:hypothetical protein